MRAELANPEASDLIWRMKYRAPEERSLSETFERVARAVASVEADPGVWSPRFGALLRDGLFLPGGRILAGAGAEGGGTLANCFVMPPVADTRDGAFDALREAVTTLAAGGGVGVDFSALRPRGAMGPDGPAPGPVAMLAVWDVACEGFLSGSARRGAMMATLRCDHPEIEAFVAAKRRPGALPRFNLSVQVTDSFMEAVAAGKSWPLVHGGQVYRTLSARGLWETIARSAYDTGEPGVLFVDEVDRANNLAWRERITAANPCGEVPLPAYGACVLGSLNLTVFVCEPFTADARLDLAAISEAARRAVRFLDDVIDLCPWPLPQQAEVARATRRVGVGVTGLADALVMLGLGYGEPRGRAAAAAAMGAIRDAAYRASVALAAERGPFPAFEREPYLRSPFVRRLPRDIRDGVALRGLRNSHLLAIAPTGSISLLAGGVSTGVEPIFAAEQTRIVADASGRERPLRLVDPALSLWRARSDRSLPPGFVTVGELSIAAHLDMQAALQPFVDNAISKTINVSANCAFETFRGVFDLAYRRRLKGCAAFRASPKREGVLQPAEMSAACPVETIRCD